MQWHIPLLSIKESKIMLIAVRTVWIVAIDTRMSRGYNPRVNMN